MTYCLPAILIFVSTAAVVPKYFVMGFTHILPGGLDHILFLLGIEFGQLAVVGLAYVSRSVVEKELVSCRHFETRLSSHRRFRPLLGGGTEYLKT